MTSTISVIVPVFNTQDYIRPALDSLLSQTVSFDEIIVIDDGSTDLSSEILKEYFLQEKIKLITQKNKGLGLTRNVGVEAATSDYIYFFDSDDLASPFLVEKIKKEIELNPDLEIIVFGAAVFYDDKFDKSTFSPTYERVDLGLYRRFFDAAVAMERSDTNYSTACLYVLKKRVIDNNNLKFNAYIHEDEAFLMNLIANVGLTLIIGDKFFNRRVRSGSIMTSKKSYNHVNGYLQASIEAQKNSEEIASKEGKKFFEIKAVQYYLSALYISYKVEGFSKYESLFKRIQGLPSYNLKPYQIISILFGRKSPKALEYFNKFRQLIKGK
ncbi:putative glycosyltransferase [Oxalobacteraceae bacterium IMCC9480]|nr:putative glycosyltransferase [Oxalobacteraceae bacterium IMCC9480]